MWSLAVNFKKYIDKQRAEGTQSANFLNVVEEFDVDGYKKRRDDKVSSSSQWTKFTLFPFQIYFVPMETWDSVIPQEFIPSQEALEAKYGNAFDPAYDESFLSDYKKIASVQDKLLRQLFVSIYILLKKQPALAETTIPIDELDVREDKKEVMTDALFRKVAEFLGINDPADCSLVLMYVHSSQQPL